MGIINATPDSFYSLSRVEGIDSSLALAQKHINEGATFIDLGGQSTRPGSKIVGPEEEWKRIGETLHELRNAFPNCLISIDTFYSIVAKRAFDLGAHLINDVSAGEMDAELPKFMAEIGLPYVIMHKLGDFETMQIRPFYEDPVNDILEWFIQKIKCLKELGIYNLVVDPGFGFGKALAHNYELLNRLDSFKILDKPILAGVSRKSMIRTVAKVESEDALNATTAAHCIALRNGANILRVHDVKEAEQAISICMA